MNALALRLTRVSAICPRDKRSYHPVEIRV